MPLHLYRADVNTLHSSPSLPVVKSNARGFLLFVAVILACLTGVAIAQQPAASQRRLPAACGAEGSTQAAMHVTQRGGGALHLCEGYALAGASSGGHGDALSLASADFDEDGVPDLVAGFGTSSTGSVTVYRGNIAVLWPYGEAIANGTPQAFLPDARTFPVDEAPDMVVTGDFDADGHLYRHSEAR